MAICQSCSMPLDKDPKKGGSEKDGSRSTKYCSYCYENGEFKQKNISAKEMQDFAMNMMVKDMKYPKFIAWIFTRSIPNLERWKVS